MLRLIGSPPKHKIRRADGVHPECESGAGDQPGMRRDRAATRAPDKLSGSLEPNSRYGCGVTSGSVALLTDKYELTMLAAALQDGTAHRRTTFEVFARRLPEGRRYGVVAG